MKVHFSRFALFFSLVTLLLGVGQVSPVQAQEGVITPTERPFRLPFANPPGPDTWLMGQPYGNTTGAYFQRYTTYGASGGIHFGVDLGAPCGTEVLALADGVVFAVDGPFGSPPHNLMIDHPQHGYASMYGHLLERPNLVPGQAVKQGEVVAKVGDSGGICYRRPHLHLEIRDLNHIRKYNPALLIEANWDNLTMIGSDGRTYMRDLAEPRKWQSLYDQPEVQTGGPIVNDFAATWPPDWERRENRPQQETNTSQNAVSLVSSTTLPPLLSLPHARQLTRGDCCTRPYWSRESGLIRYIDQPSGGLLGIWEVDPGQPEAGPQLITERLTYFSPDGKLRIYPDQDKEVVVLEQVADGKSWEIDTRGNQLSFSPDSQTVIWFESEEDDGPNDNRLEEVWLAEVDSSNPHRVTSLRRSGPVAWLGNDRLLMSRRVAGSSDQELFSLSLVDGSQESWQTVPRMRGTALSTDRRYLVYYVNSEPDTAKNGVWMLDFQNPTQPPQKLPFFGTYRWRDAERLIYIPFDLEAIEHNFYEYDTSTGQSRLLFPGGTGLRLANNDWQISPDGSQIVLLAAKERGLDGIWVLEIEE